MPNTYIRAAAGRLKVGKEQVAALVTNDRWMKEGGQLDATDREILREASHGGKFKVRVINIREMLETMEKTEPQRFKKLAEHMGEQYGHAIKSMDEFEAICSVADERLHGFQEVAKAMDLGEASQIRLWRIDGRMTWRAVARAAYHEGFLQRRWEPPWNQLMGIALTERAAQFSGEDFRKPPWN